MKDINYDTLKAACKMILEAIGENPDREGLKETPRRFANRWKEFIEYNPGTTSTAFESVRSDQMVVVSGMRVWSMCEHHLLPFWCDVSIAYITNDKVLGLSKFGRIAQKHAHKLQLQEQLTTDIGNEIMKLLGHKDVAVISRGQHLCMTMRGISMPSLMTSSYLSGEFKNDPIVRSEFLALSLTKGE